MRSLLDAWKSGKLGGNEKLQVSVQYVVTFCFYFFEPGSKQERDSCRELDEPSKRLAEKFGVGCDWCRRSTSSAARVTRPQCRRTRHGLPRTAASPPLTSCSVSPSRRRSPPHWARCARRASSKHTVRDSDDRTFDRFWVGHGSSCFHLAASTGCMIDAD
jgi:hypothetical protein